VFSFFKFARQVAILLESSTLSVDVAYLDAFNRLFL